MSGELARGSRWGWMDQRLERRDLRNPDKREEGLCDCLCRTDRVMGGVGRGRSVSLEEKG